MDIFGEIVLFPSHSKLPADAWLPCEGQELKTTVETPAYFSLSMALHGHGGYQGFRLPDLKAASPQPTTQYYLSVKGRKVFPTSGEGQFGNIFSFHKDKVGTKQGWLVCNGQKLFKDHFPALFELFKYKYGGKDQVFALPNLSAEALHPDMCYCIRY